MQRQDDQSNHQNNQQIENQQQNYHESSFEQEQQYNLQQLQEQEEQDEMEQLEDLQRQHRYLPRGQVKIEEPGVFQTQQGKKYKTYDPNFLQSQFDQLIPNLVQKPVNRKKHKGTNIPKFLLKVFFNNIPSFPDTKHIQRLQEFAKRPQKSKTRFHLVQLFGTTVTDNQMDHQNQLNRRVLKRLLNHNYDNILTNKHIRNKRLYLLFCKKMMLRLNKPQLIDRLQI